MDVELVTPHEQQVRQWGMILHFSQFAGYVIPLAGLLVPIIIWQIKKNDMPVIDAHGKNIVNWIISALIYAVICFIFSFVLIGLPFFIVLGVLCVAFPVVAGIKANNGEVWKYPLAIRFLK